MITFLLKIKIKPKAFLSLSLVCLKVAKERNENEETTSHLDYYDEHLDCFFRFHGLFVYLESEKLQQINLILIKTDKTYLTKIRELFEKDDVTKILFFTQKHARVLFKSMNINLKVFFSNFFVKIKA